MSRPSILGIGNHLSPSSQKPQLISSPGYATLSHFLPLEIIRGNMLPSMANLEAGTSSGAARESGGKFHVFLNFRGEDTRYNFTDFLYDRLVDAGVHVFIDEDQLHVGEVIGENLIHAIDNSTLYIPIFSRTYGSSKWCLRELTRMVDNESKSEGKKSILPIFLDVEPEDIKLKTQLYEEAFMRHEEEFPDELEAWKKALRQIDEIKGWNVKKDQG